MKIEYEITLADYKAAFALHFRRHIASRISHIFVFVIFPGLAALDLVYEGYLALTQRDYLRRNPPETLIFVVIVALLPLLYRYRVRKQFSRIFPKGWRDRRVLIDIDDERLISAIPGASGGKYLWNSIVKFEQDERVTLFYTSKNRFILMPTQVMSQSDRKELSDLIARRLDAKAAC